MNNMIDYPRHKREKYASPAPYPEVRVLRPNSYYATLLMDDYAGIVSEFSAISQYLYHYFSLKDIAAELGELLENVAVTEMLHMEILAGTIKLLGGNPVIRGSFSTGGNYWNGSFIYYGNMLCEQLRADLNAEYQAIRNYRYHISLINDPYVQAILERIILDETVHAELFIQALDKYCR
jgi:bacterioferritin